MKILSALSFLPIVLAISGCSMAPRRWTAPDMGPAPNRLTVYMAPIKVDNMSDLRDDLGLDEKRLKEWLAITLTDSVRVGTGIQEIVWIDSLATAVDTHKVLASTRSFLRPASNDGQGWILTVNGVNTDRRSTGYGTYSTSQELAISGDYQLLDWSTGKQLAYGWARGSSGFSMYMDRSNWEEARGEFASWFRWGVTRRVDTTKAK